MRLGEERDRITAQIGALEEARARLDAVIDHAEHPTPEHCPALRTPATAATAA